VERRKNHRHPWGRRQVRQGDPGHLAGCARRGEPGERHGARPAPLAGRRLDHHHLLAQGRRGAGELHAAGAWRATRWQGSGLLGQRAAGQQGLATFRPGYPHLLEPRGHPVQAGSAAPDSVQQHRQPRDLGGPGGAGGPAGGGSAGDGVEWDKPVTVGGVAHRAVGPRRYPGGRASAGGRTEGHLALRRAGQGPAGGRKPA